MCWAALELADEYQIRLWIAALLDPEPITHGNDITQITSPPPYRKVKMANGDSFTGRSPEKKQPEGRHSTRSRRSASVRSESPGGASQARTPGRPKATPRKPRKTRGTLSRVDEGAASVEPESVNGDAKLGPGGAENAKVEVETIEDDERENTRVNVEMPTGYPDLPIPADTEAMLNEARRMVAEAQRLGGGEEGSTTTKKGKGKRKAEEMVEEDDEVGLEGPAATAKKARRVEVELRKEKIKRRALTGIAGSLALG